MRAHDHEKESFSRQMVLDTHRILCQVISQPPKKFHLFQEIYRLAVLTKKPDTPYSPIEVINPYLRTIISVTTFLNSESQKKPYQHDKPVVSRHKIKS